MTTANGVEDSSAAPAPAYAGSAVTEDFIAAQQAAHEDVGSSVVLVPGASADAIMNGDVSCEIPSLGAVEFVEQMDVVVKDKEEGEIEEEGEEETDDSSSDDSDDSDDSDTSDESDEGSNSVESHDAEQKYIADSADEDEVEGRTGMKRSMLDDEFKLRKDELDEMLREVDDMDEETKVDSYLGDSASLLESLEVQLKEDQDFTEAGTLLHIIENNVVMKPTNDTTCFDLDSIIFWEDKSVFGRVIDVFGPVSSPLFLLQVTRSTFEKANQIVFSGEKPTGSSLKLFFSKDNVNFVRPELLKEADVSEASDEEELYFSDDEKEKAYYEMKSKTGGKTRKRKPHDDAKSNVPLDMQIAAAGASFPESNGFSQEKPSSMPPDFRPRTRPLQQPDRRMPPAPQYGYAPPAPFQHGAPQMHWAPAPPVAHSAPVSHEAPMEPLPSGGTENPFIFASSWTPPVESGPAPPAAYGYPYMHSVNPSYPPPGAPPAMNPYGYAPSPYQGYVPAAPAPAPAPGSYDQFGQYQMHSPQFNTRGRGRGQGSGNRGFRGGRGRGRGTYSNRGGYGHHQAPQYAPQQQSGYPAYGQYPPPGHGFGGSVAPPADASMGNRYHQHTESEPRY